MKTRRPVERRDASEPFEIPYTEKPYYLTSEQLADLTGPRLKDRSHWSFPNFKFISFKNRVLLLQVDDRHNTVFDLTITIEPEKLCVCCSCGMAVEILCVHALKALEKLNRFLYDGKHYFEMFCPGGPMEIGLNHPEFFDCEIREETCRFKPKKQAGAIYAFSREFNFSSFTDLLKLPVASEEVLPDKGNAIAYVVIYSYYPWSIQPPFIVPCRCTLNKAETDVIGFEAFFSGITQEAKPYLTVSEQHLNKICQEIFQIAENAHFYLLKGYANVTNVAKLQQMYNLWARALPTLRRQEHVFRHPLLPEEYLKAKPIKKHAYPFNFGKGRPELFFELTEKGTYYQLHLKVTIAGKTVAKFNQNPIMFFIEHEDTYYFVTSLMDAGVIEWMGKENNCHIIFKEHFDEFQRLYLEPLKKHYRVVIR